MATPDTRSSLVIIKQFTYRGSIQVWTNRYHFEGTLPPDPAHWTTFADAVIAAEKAPLADNVVIIGAAGYDSASATSTNPHGDKVWEKTYSVDGLLDGTGRVQVPGDCAAIVRYDTDARTSRNHPVYLFNYYHGVYRDSGGGPDNLASGQLSAFNTYAAAWVAGFSDGAITHERCGPRGAVAVGHATKDKISHRDFPG
jgi:hypothetical protein